MHGGLGVAIMLGKTGLPSIQKAPTRGRSFYKHDLLPTLSRRSVNPIPLNLKLGFKVRIATKVIHLEGRVHRAGHLAVGFFD
ncbi:MAG: hypothetical protein JNK33_03175, partial [Candidatus Doudnabacteria bacterium]|nr:hypothetical protein [Candidatus Doudnabacteria bacterium]